MERLSLIQIVKEKFWNQASERVVEDIEQLLVVLRKW